MVAGPDTASPVFADRLPVESEGDDSYYLRAIRMEDGPLLQGFSLGNPTVAETFDDYSDPGIAADLARTWSYAMAVRGSMAAYVILAGSQAETPAPAIDGIVYATFDDVELGRATARYALAEGARHKGVMTASMTAFAGELRDVWGIEAVGLGILNCNYPAKGVARRLGAQAVDPPVSRLTTWEFNV